MIHWDVKTYSYNDTLGRLKVIAYEKIYDLIQRQNAMSTDDDNNENDEHIVSLRERAENDIEFVYYVKH